MVSEYKKMLDAFEKAAFAIILFILLLSTAAAGAILAFKFAYYLVDLEF